ncbi:MAG: hypothetical protein ACREIA_17280, partial [Opitutaceae bacterium]
MFVFIVVESSRPICRAAAAEPGYVTSGENLELVGRAVEKFAGEFKRAGNSRVPYEGSEIAEPIIQQLDLGSRSLSITQLKTSGGQSQSLSAVRSGFAAVAAPSAVPVDASGSGLNISRDGNTVVGYIDNGFFTPSHAFRWTEATGIVDLGTLDPPNNASRSSSANDVSDDGAVVVGSSHTSGGTFSEHAFRWTQAGGMVDLGTGFGFGTDRNSRAFGVSGDGSVVVGESAFPPPSGSSFDTTRAFRWTAGGGMQSLGALETVGTSLASAVTADGVVVVGHGSVSFMDGTTQTTRTRAFRWTETSGTQNLGILLGHEYSAAVAVSDDGAVVVGISSTGIIDRNGGGGGFRYGLPESRAFYWTAAGGMQDLTQLLSNAGVDMTGKTLVGVTGISPDGKWISAVTTRPDPEFPEILDSVPVFASLTETLPPPSRLLNLSTRGQTLTGDNVLIPGFVIQGSVSKRLLIRAAGPALAQFGVQGVLPD